MGIRTVRLDQETEKALERLRRTTGLSISEVLKRGIHAYAQEAERPQRSAYEVYSGLDLGEGGWSVAPARDAKRAVRDVLRRKRPS